MAVLTAPAPAGALTVVLVSARLSRGTHTVAHPVIGRADAIPVLGSLRARAGTLTFHCPSLAAADTVVHHHHHPTTKVGVRVVLTTAEHPSLSGMPYVALAHAVEQWDRPAGGWTWRVSVDVVEVA
jgi:hypothetical protein